MAALSLDLRHLAWSLAHSDYVVALADAIDATDSLRVQHLLTEIDGWPVHLSSADPIDAGEWRTYRRQCETRGLDADRVASVLTILLHTMQGAEGCLYA